MGLSLQGCALISLTAHPNHLFVQGGRLRRRLTPVLDVTSMIEYVWLKFLHILIAIIALGTSAGLGIVMEFYGDHPIHGLFVLRAVKRLVILVVIPGYLFMVVTGLWLTHLSWSFTFRWIQAALILWVLGAVTFAVSLVPLHKQIALFETNGPTSASYKRVSLVGRFFGGTSGLIIVIIVYLMVAKPNLAW